MAKKKTKKNEHITYENEMLGCKFSLPEVLTIRQQLDYQSRIWGTDEENASIQFWQGVQPLLEDWQCDAMPEPDKVNLDVDTDPKHARIVFWVANQAAGYFLDKEYVPKNE